MLQEAIERIFGTMNTFPQIFRFSIIESNDIEISISDHKESTKRFNSAVEMLEWCEKNLTQKP